MSLLSTAADSNDAIRAEHERLRKLREARTNLLCAILVYFLLIVGGFSYVAYQSAAYKGAQRAGTGAAGQQVPARCDCHRWWHQR